MGRHSQPRGDSATAVVDGPPRVVELDAFQGAPRERIDVAKLAPFGWAPAVVLALVGFIDKAETSIVGGVLEQLKAEFGFTDTMAGVVFAAPSFAAIFLLIPAGIFADTKRRKDILVAVIIVWSVLSFGSAAAPTLVVFFIFRLMIGTAAPLNVPATASLIGDFYPVRSRTRAFSIVRSVENAGLPAGTLIGSVVGELIGWRAAFIVVGIPGLILAFALYRMLREPRRGVGDVISALAGDRVGPSANSPVAGGGAAVAEVIEPPQLNAAAGSQGPPPYQARSPYPPAPTAVTTPVATPKPPFGADLARRVGELLGRLREIFRIPTVRRLVLGEAVLFASFAGIFAFSVSFFARAYYDNPATETVETASAGAIVSIGSVPFIFGGAYLASKIDLKYARNNPALRVSVSLVALLVGAVLIVAFIFVEPLALRALCFYLFAGANIIAVANLAAAVADVIPARIRGSGFAVLQVCLALGGSFGPLVVGLASGASNDDLRWGYGALLLPLLGGAFLISRGRSTYPVDVAVVVAESAGAPPVPDPLAGTGTNTNGKRALICGLLCIVLVPLAPLIGLLGLVFGISALKEIKASPQYGRGMALTGIWLSSIFGLLGLLLLVRFASK